MHTEHLHSAAVYICIMYVQMYINRSINSYSKSKSSIFRIKTEEVKIAFMVHAL
ncbi:uncharacterized protein DS421_18g623680 [Arachis hypogaea]|nr:uncharacterized protein DS421_18g623680 [Arachis hypogaea]